jgi:hypothetical protein
MKNQKEKKWKLGLPAEELPQKPQFYLTDREKKDGQSSRIHRWLELADRLFDSNDDSDPTPSAA